MPILLSNDRAEWIHQFLNALGRLPEWNSLQHAVTWALQTHQFNPSQRPEAAARAFAQRNGRAD